MELFLTVIALQLNKLAKSRNVQTRLRLKNEAQFTSAEKEAPLEPL